MEYSKLILGVYNSMLDDLKKDPKIPRGIPTESDLAIKYSVSRSTIRKVNEIMFLKSIAIKDGPNKILLRLPKSGDYFSPDEVDNSKSDKAERAILKKLYSYNLKPGNKFSELELSKELNTNTVTIREALFSISQTGLIKKRSGQKWEVVALTQSKIDQLIKFRSLLENYAMDCFKEYSSNDENLKPLELLLQKHQDLKKRKKKNIEVFTKLEKEFHYTLLNKCNNKFIEKSYHSLFILIRYHIGQITYDHTKINKVLDQHINVLEALLSNDFKKAKAFLQFHLDHAENSMKEINRNK